ncbi:MAG: HDIG domain-containing metalloprotein [Desulfocapsaceae bacterium]
MNIPSINQCLALMDNYGMLDNIQEHSFIVARVAETIVNGLLLPGKETITAPDLDLVLAGALLHDIAKTKCLDGSCQHAEEGMAICTEHNYPEVGQIVKQHVILSSFRRDDYKRGHFPAREIIYYSDKRVRHNEIVPLSQRLDYIIDKYSGGKAHIIQRIRDNFALCVELENYLFGFLPFDPADLANKVNPAPFTTS